jgi:acyl carrier protein
MVPAAYVQMPALPLTPNGKLDRKGLLLIEPGGYETSHQYEAPLGETEVKLAAIWQDVLHLPRVGRQDNFFEVGGNSLTAVHLISKVSTSFAAQVPVQVVFQDPTVQKMAQTIETLLSNHDNGTTAGTEAYNQGLI